MSTVQRKPKFPGISWPPSQTMGSISILFVLLSRGPGKLPEREKSPKVVRGLCIMCFGPREQRSSKSLSRHPNLFCTGATPFRTGARGFLFFFSPGAKDLLHPLLPTLEDFPLPGNFPGPWLPNFCANCSDVGQIDQKRPFVHNSVCSQFL